jgi:hypothetical protein
MIRSLLALVLLGSVADAAPIPKSLKARKPADLVGTKWITTRTIDNAMNEYTFLDDGLLQYRYNALDTTVTNGTWSLYNSDLTIEINKYSFHTGTVDDDTITMQSKNKSGMEWVTVLTKKTEEK